MTLECKAEVTEQRSVPKSKSYQQSHYSKTQDIPYTLNTKAEKSLLTVESGLATQRAAFPPCCPAAHSSSGPDEYTPIQTSAPALAPSTLAVVQN